jgi:hypothetical protein
MLPGHVAVHGTPGVLAGLFRLSTHQCCSCQIVELLSSLPTVCFLPLQVDKEVAKCIELMVELETAVATKKQHR